MLDQEQFRLAKLHACKAILASKDREDLLDTVQRLADGFRGVLEAHKEPDLKENIRRW